MFRQKCMWLFCLLAMAGCGQNHKQALEGTVTLDGKPLVQGSITFTPAPGTPGTAAAGKIMQGRFSIASTEGVLPGTFRVEISAVRKTGKKLQGEMGVEFDDLEHLIPPRYNRQSELSVEVQEGGPNCFEFAFEIQ